MKGASTARAHKRATGTCRNRRRRRRATRRAEWVRPYRHAQRILDSVANLLHWSMAAASVEEERLKKLPVHTAQELTRSLRRLVRAGLRIIQAREELTVAVAALNRTPVRPHDDAPEILAIASNRCTAASDYLHYVLGEVLLRQTEVLAGLGCGELVPERPGDRRPRIVVRPRLIFARAFLRRRRPRVLDRIAAILRRRRRTPRPAAIRVPRRSTLGRAPPVSTGCPH